MQADAEHQQDDADLGELRRQHLVGDKTRGERADHHAGEQIADERRDAQPVGDRAEDEGEPDPGHDRGDQRRRVMHVSGSTHSGAAHNFPCRVRAMSDEALEGLLGNAKLIRHWGKLKSVRDNAAAMLEVAAEHKSFGAWLAGWPGEDIVGLWEALAKRFSQMGGNSGPSVLRMVGKDTFILTPSVTSALKHWGAISAPPKNRADRAAVQAAFNGWAKESGRPLCQLSLIVAMSHED